MIDIGRATASDAAAMAPLLTQLGYPTAVEVVPHRLAAIEREGGVAFIARDDSGKVVGLISGARHATLHAGDRVAYITALVTDAEARGQGVGRALVAAIEQWARESGCTRLSVTSAEHRADAHAFYPRCGFPYSGRRFSKLIEAATP
jgi:GNAT superfamily N-acetyltransferase